MKLDPNRFNAFLGEVGQDVAWRHAHWCPCRDPKSGASSPDCSVCTNGVIWDPVACCKLAVAGQKVQQAWAGYGMWEKGDVVCTLPSDSAAYNMGKNDRVRFDESSQPFSIVYTYTGAPIVLDYSVDLIERLFWLNDDLSAIIEGTVVNIPVLPNGTLVFGSVAPPVGKQFTLTGRRRPEYYCFEEFPQDRAHFAGRTLPRRVVLRSFDLFRRVV